MLFRDPAGHILTGCEDHVCQNIILNLSPGIQRNLVGLTMSIVIIASYILLLAPAREHIENYILTTKIIYLYAINKIFNNIYQNIFLATITC